MVYVLEFLERVLKMFYFEYALEQYIGNLCLNNIPVTGSGFNNFVPPSNIQNPVYFSGFENYLFQDTCTPLYQSGVTSGIFTGVQNWNTTGIYNGINYIGSDVKSGTINETINLNGYISGNINGTTILDSGYLTFIKISGIASGVGSGNIYGFGDDGLIGTVVPLYQSGNIWNVIEGYFSGIISGIGSYSIQSTGCNLNVNTNSQYNLNGNWNSNLRITGFNNFTGIKNEYFSGIQNGYISGGQQTYFSGIRTGLCFQNQTNLNGCNHFPIPLTGCNQSGTLNIVLSYPANNQVFQIQVFSGNQNG